MNIQEAYDVLGLSQDSSIDEIKSKYKQLAKEWHPDINKSEGSEDKFKQINAAFQLIKDSKENPNPFKRVDFGDFNIQDFFVNFQQPKQKNFKYTTSINLSVNIPFKESITGTDKEIKYDKYIKCIDCDGNGSISISNNCKNCNGFGRITTNSNGMFYSQTCSKCFGRNITFKDCSKCNKVGVNQISVNGKIRIPQGSKDKSYLRLRNAGNYISQSITGEDMHTEVIVQIFVEKDDDLSLIDNDIISNINISLLEAISGCNKDVKTIFDIKNITIPELSKNKDEIIIDGCGVKPNGVQKVIINVEYPNNIEELKNALRS